MVDIALAYNPQTKCCDVIRNGSDFALDTTPASAMLMSICANKRAKPDAMVPTVVTDWASPESFTARGGYAGDALSVTGSKIGSWMYLLQRSLATEQTRIDAQNYLADCLGWLESVRGLAVQIKVRWLAPQILGYLVRAGNTNLQLKQVMGA